MLEIGNCALKIIQIVKKIELFSYYQSGFIITRKTAFQ